MPSSIIVTSGALTADAQEMVECLLGALIPRDDTQPDISEEDERRAGFELEEEEIRRAVWRIGPKKAPGLDGIRGCS